MPDQMPYGSGYSGKHKVLVIGVDDYSGGAMPSLSGVTQDVAQFYETLANSDYLKGKHEDIDYVKPQNGPWTKKNILQALHNLQATTDIELRRSQLSKEQAIIIYVAGHAKIRETRDGIATAHFVPSDYVDGDWNTLLSVDQILDARHFMAAKHVFFIFSFCYSGMALMHSPLALNITPDFWVRHMDSEAAQKRGDDQKITGALARFMGYRAYQVLSASNYDVKIPDTWSDAEIMANAPIPEEWEKRSPFNQVLCEGLAGEAADDFGFITADMLGAFVRHRLGVQYSSKALPRFGYLAGHTGGDMILGKKDPAHRISKARKSHSVSATADENTQSDNYTPYKTAVRRAGVIALISPSSARALDMIGMDKTQWEGIEHHRLAEQNAVTLPLQKTSSNDNVLRYLWLVHTEESEEVAVQMSHAYLEVDNTIHISLHLVADAYIPLKTRTVVANIISHARALPELPPEQIILDITGGTTPMSIGAALAALSNDPPIEMQYCSLNHFAFSGGRPDTTKRTKAPIVLETS